MKSRLFDTVVVATVATMVLGAASTANAKLKRINIGSNPAGSVYFLLAGGFAKLFQKELKIRANAQPHAGSSVYLPLMDKGEIVLGLNSSLDSGMAVAGTAPFKSKMKNVRMIARVWILPYAYVVKENSGIKTLADLRNKRVLVKVKTNVSLAQANSTLLSTAGLTASNVDAVDSGGVVAGINSVVEGRAMAATAALTMPALRKAHATVPGGLRVLGLGPKANNEFMAKGMAGLYTMTIKPSKRLPFVKSDTLIAAFDSYLNAGPQVSDDDAYALAKALHTNWKKLQKDYPPLRGTPQKALAPANNAMPYHPGAIRYWKEIGMWTATNEADQAKVLSRVR
jgi:TRAP transporter TAXI family solute receptor